MNPSQYCFYDRVTKLPYFRSTGKSLMYYQAGSTLPKKDNHARY